VVADYATLLRDHVTLSCRSVDRIFLQAYVPRLQTVGWVCQFLRWQRGYSIPSSAAFGKIGDAYVAEVYRFARANGIPVRRFVRGETKEEVARPYLEAAAAEGGAGRVVLIGTAQEKARVWRSWKAKGQQNAAHPHMEWGRQMTFIQHFYFYLWDPEWGGAFWKTNAYAPFPVWIWLNGHERAKQQLAKAGIGFTALDNGFGSCEDPALLQRVCDRLGPGAVTSFFWRWFHRLPSPFTAADLRGHGTGVIGDSASNIGALGTSHTGTGVHGVSTSGWGVSGDTSSGFGVFGQSATGDGVVGASSSGLAGFFDGNVLVTGSLFKPGGGFRIDHPLDAAGKYLSHSFVESPDMKNLYDGVVTLDASGQAEVSLPAWFAALNTDVRYQLCCLGGHAPVYIAQKLRDNQFTIAGGQPGMEVCWQVTGIRQDRWAAAHRVPVEQDKSAQERGHYLDPELYGEPSDKGMLRLRHRERGHGWRLPGARA
jgi:hypothetical protein